MKTSAVLAVLFAGAAMATPTVRTGGSGGSSGSSSGSSSYSCDSTLFSQKKCCDTGVLGLLGLGCAGPKSSTSLSNFKSSCSSDGKAAYCCVLPVADLGVLCQPAV